MTKPRSVERPAPEDDEDEAEPVPPEVVPAPEGEPAKEPSSTTVSLPT